MHINSLVGRPTRAEIDLSAIYHNVKALKSLIGPQTRFCAVVKADGYGHGAVQTAYRALSAGADYLAVAILDEALILRSAGIKEPILILGYTPRFYLAWLSLLDLPKPYSTWNRQRPWRQLPTA